MPHTRPPAVAVGALSGQPQPILTVDDLVLRPWVPGDAGAVAAAYADPDIARWHARTMTVDEALAWIDGWADQWQAETAASWAVVGPDDALLGRMGIQKLVAYDGRAHVAYWVVPAARGRRVAPRALEAMTRWAFEEAGLHRLQLEHSVQNEASCRVAVKAGYAAEGTARGSGLHADGWHDMHVHARLAGDPPD